MNIKLNWPVYTLVLWEGEPKGEGLDRKQRELLGLFFLLFPSDSEMLKSTASLWNICYLFVFFYSLSWKWTFIVWGNIVFYYNCLVMFSIAFCSAAQSILHFGHVAGPCLVGIGKPSEIFLMTFLLQGFFSSFINGLSRIWILYYHDTVSYGPIMFVWKKNMFNILYW